MRETSADYLHTDLIQEKIDQGVIDFFCIFVLLTRMTYGQYVEAVAFRPDGKYVVAGGCDERKSNNFCIKDIVRVWEALTGKEIAIMIHDGLVENVAFSPDGMYVVSGGDFFGQDMTIHVWEAMTGREVARMTHDDAVKSITFSPDGKYVASASDDTTVRVWNAMTGKEVALMTHDHFVFSVAFSPDGKYVVSGSGDTTARVWEAMTGKEVARMIHNDYVNSVAFSPDGKYVASASDDKTVRVWRYRSEDLIANACSRLPRNLTPAEWKQYIDTLPYQAVCPNLPVEPEAKPTP